jgi:hypothetical protein
MGFPHSICILVKLPTYSLLDPGLLGAALNVLFVSSPHIAIAIHVIDVWVMFVVFCELRLVFEADVLWRFSIQIAELLHGEAG